MKLPRFLSPRFASTFALGCALLALVPLPRAQAQGSPALLTTDTINKMIAFSKAMAADPAMKEEFDAPQDDHMNDTLEKGGSINAEFTAKCPKSAAAMKSVGLTPDEFFKSLTSLMAASMAAAGQLPVDEHAPDADTLRKNAEFVKSHKALLDELKKH